MWACEVVPVESILAGSGEPKLLNSALCKKTENNKKKITWCCSRTLHHYFFPFAKMEYLPRCVINRKFVFSLSGFHTFSSLIQCYRISFLSPSSPTLTAWVGLSSAAAVLLSSALLTSARRTLSPSRRNKDRTVSMVSHILWLRVEFYMDGAKRSTPHHGSHLTNSEERCVWRRESGELRSKPVKCGSGHGCGVKVGG